MPYEIKFERPPVGYSISAARGGDKVSVQYIEFTSTEDGQHFIQRLEGFPDEIIQKVSAYIDIRPSQVDHLLAIIRKDGSATVHVNELPQILSVRVARALEKGEAIYKDDIVDIAQFELGEIKIPDDCGVAYLFSIGWRKGFFYDFGPLAPNPVLRNFDCQNIFGQLYAHVFFQERFSISDAEWGALFASKWFPFSLLKNETIQEILNYIRAGWNPDELTDRIVEEVKARSDKLVESWANHPVLKPHLDILRRAIEHFRNNDYLSCAALLYPRIEGIMRSNLNEVGRSKANQSNLTSAAVATKIVNPKCLLLPHRFNQYLKEVYFANFDPQSREIDVSRHSISHGVASCNKLDAKAAVIGILVTHHLFYCCEFDKVSERPSTGKESEN